MKKNNQQINPKISQILEIVKGERYITAKIIIKTALAALKNESKVI